MNKIFKNKTKQNIYCSGIWNDRWTEKQLREKLCDLSSPVSPSVIYQLERWYGHRVGDQMMTFASIHIKYLVTKGSLVL